MEILVTHPETWRHDIRQRTANRHYYLRMAIVSIKLKEIVDMHNFCALAEKEQQHIDELTYPVS